jgi:hypothetical protein
MLDHVVAQGFAEASLLDYFRSVPDVPTLMAGLRAAL